MGKGEHVGHKKKSQECNCINCKCKPRVGERYAKNTDLLKSHIPVGTEGNYSTTFQSDYTKKPLSVADTERENYLTTHFAMGTVPTDYDTHNSVLYNGKGGKPSTPIRMAETAYKSTEPTEFTTTNQSNYKVPEKAVEFALDNDSEVVSSGFIANVHFAIGNADEDRFRTTNQDLLQGGKADRAAIIKPSGAKLFPNEPDNRFTTEKRDSFVAHPTSPTNRGASKNIAQETNFSLTYGDKKFDGKSTNMQAHPKLEPLREPRANAATYDSSVFTDKTSPEYKSTLTSAYPKHDLQKLSRPDQGKYLASSHFRLGEAQVDLTSTNAEAFVKHSTATTDPTPQPDNNKSNIWLPSTTGQFSTEHRDAYIKHNTSSKRVTDQAIKAHHFNLGYDDTNYNSVAQDSFVTPALAPVVLASDHQLLKSSVPIGTVTSAYSQEGDASYTTINRQTFMKPNGDQYRKKPNSSPQKTSVVLGLMADDERQDIMGTSYKANFHTTCCCPQIDKCCGGWESEVSTPMTSYRSSSTHNHSHMPPIKVAVR